MWYIAGKDDIHLLSETELMQSGHKLESDAFSVAAIFIKLPA